MALVSTPLFGKEEVVASNGVVTAMQPEAAEAGLAILKAGGNAVDAAVCIAFCNVVLEPDMATIAGLGYMLVHMAAEGRTYAIDFNSRAPRKARPDMYDVIGPSTAGGFQTFEVRGDANNVGPLSVSIPATCAGLCESHRRFGTLPLEQVLEPAAALASDGFEVSWHGALTAANNFEKWSKDPYLASMWLPGGRPPVSRAKPADRVVQKDLGRLLANIGRNGPDALYKGEVASAIEEFVTGGGGLLTAQDLADYAPTVSDPMSASFNGHEIKVVPTPSGGITNLQTFNILDSFDLLSMRHNSAQYLHTFIEAARHAFADRYRYLADWERAQVPLDGMLSHEYANYIAGQMSRERAETGAELEEEPWIHYLDRAVHDPWRFQNGARPVHASEAVAMDSNDEDTTHLNVVDRDRNVVSCTHTAGMREGLFPSGTGVYLAGGMGWFVAKPGYPNSVDGWKRPMNNMSPLIAFRDGRPVLSQGAPGARRIMNRGVQVVANVLVFGMAPQKAVGQPVVDASSMATVVDDRINSAVIEELREMGHSMEPVTEDPGSWNFARPTAIQIDYESGLLRAGVDPFRAAMAMGY